MASKTGRIWALDLGNNGLKALHLSIETGTLEVIGFDNIQHGKILTSSVEKTEKDELIALSLRQFVTQNEIGKDELIISVASQNSFARFVNLPPVEKKRIPEIVKFEAAQQIPFDINDIQWDWQLMGETEKGENIVGIFAIKNEEVDSLLNYFGGEGIQPSYVQMTPMALYNFVSYEYSEILKKSEQNGIIVLDIGADNTDLVVCTESSVWQRSIPMGGNNFTEAIAEGFKLKFAKAEKLKRTAPMSKYARQIYQAMKPVFTDLGSEIQRSLNFYSRSNAKTKFVKAIAFGGGTKMRGLLKYLQQTLNVPVEKPDTFKKLGIGSEVSEAKFHEHVSDFGVVYGLALQSLGLGKIESNLLPQNISRSMEWVRKSKYFTVAACLLLVVSVLAFARTFFDRMKYETNSNIRSQIKNVIQTANTAENKLQSEKSKSPKSQSLIAEAEKSLRYREVVPTMYQTILSALPNAENNPGQKELYQAFAKTDINTILRTPRKDRKQMFVTSMAVRFADDIDAASFGSTDFVSGGKREQKGKRRSGMAEALKLLMQQASGKSKKSAYGVIKSTARGKKGAKSTEAIMQPGFVVSIAGYTPYRKPLELMDPAGVGDDRGKWGFITRLMNLDEVMDANSPFKLYKKDDMKQFDLKQPKEIDIVDQMPKGIGIEDTRVTKDKNNNSAEERVLIDPMTKEIISKVAELDSNGKQVLDNSGNVVYQVNDHWFALDMKFVWEEPSPAFGGSD